MREIVIRELEESAGIKKAAAQDLSDVIAEAAQTVIKAYRSGKKVLLIGNGGSAADAQHIASELVGRFLMERKALPAIALTTDTSVLTSVANDYGFPQIFCKQVAALVKEGDVVLGLSTSGTSPNVVSALRLAREMGAVTVGLTGREGGQMKEVCDLCICVPCDLTPMIQEAHIAVSHALCDYIERTIFEGSHRINV